MSYPFCEICCHQLNEGEHLSKFLPHEFEPIIKKDRMCIIMISFSQLDLIDQRCSETPQSVTNKIDIRGLHSAEGHCYFQYSERYSA